MVKQFALIVRDEVYRIYDETEPALASMNVVDITTTTPTPQVGWSYANGVFSPPAAIPFATTQAAKAKQVDQWRTAARYVDVTVPVGGVSRIWQADQGSQDLLSNAVNLAINGIVPSPPSWRTSDNIDVVVTLTDLKSIAAAMAAQTSIAFYHSFQLKNQVAAATTQAQLDAIIW